MMKKNLLAASLALALGSLSGAASAAPALSNNGIGHYNLVPYYSVQDGNNTLINIVNTDTKNGKAVKVRFRAAEWSDDALDFQVFLSPGDVWTGAVGLVDGVPKLVTKDNSCTLPAYVRTEGATFPTTRVEGREAARLNEGYVEIFVMADIPEFAWSVTGGAPGAESGTKNPLWTATKHVNNVAPCTASVLEDDSTGLKGYNVLQVPADVALGAIDTVEKAATKPASWLTGSTGGIMTNVTIIKVSDSKAFSFPATALTEGAATVQYFRQSNELVSELDATPGGAAGKVTVTDANLRLATADRLFYSKSPAGAALTYSLAELDDPTTIAARGAAYPIYSFDLPDLSTPFVAGSNAYATRNAIASLINDGASAVVEYTIEPGLKATTDVVFSQPMRRYFYQYIQTADGAAVATGKGNRTIQGTEFLVQGQNQSVYNNITVANKLAVGKPVFWNREEGKGSSGIVVSPIEPGDNVALHGEVSVVSVKNGALPTGSLGAKLTAANWQFAENYESGWANLSLVAAYSGAAAVVSPEANVRNLPVIGFTAINIFNAGAGAAGTNYGIVHPLRKQ